MTDRGIVPLPSAGEVAEQGFDLREALGFTWRHWKFVVAVTALFAIVGGVLLMQKIPLYTASSQILLDQDRVKPPGDQSVLQATGVDLSLLESQMAIIRSAALLRRVVERNHLESDPAFAVHPESSPPLIETVFANVKSFVSSLLSSTLSMAATTPPTPAQPEPEFKPAASDPIPAKELPIIRSLSGILQVAHAQGAGDVLTVSVTAADPVLAAKLTNEIADTYLVDKLDARFDAAKRASTWLDDRLVALQKQLHDSEEAVEEFKAKNGLVQSANGVTLSQQQLSELNASLVTAKADLAQKKAQVDQLNSIAAKGGSLQDIASITNAGNLLALRQQEAALSVQKAQLLTRYDSSHPMVINIEAQLRDVQHSIAAETQRLAAAIKNDYAVAQAREASLQASLKQATGQTNIDDATAIHLRELQRTAEVNKTLFEDFLKQAKITQADASFEPQDARIITPAMVPGQPSSPDKTRFMAVTLFLGLLSGVGGAFAKEKLRPGFATPKEIEEQLGLPLLGSVHRLTAKECKDNGRAIPIHSIPVSKPVGRYSKSIRSLRSGIQMTDVDHPPKVIQVTSATPGEGKTTIALSMAVSAAGAKHEVLFIDADLRHPSASKAFGVGEEIGLVDVLAGKVELQDAVKYHQHLKLWFLPAGNKTQSAADLLGSQRMKSLLAGLRDKFDLIVVDTPPSGPVIDPVVVSHLCDKILYVVRWGATPRELVKQSVAQLSGHRKIGGVAFNMVNEKQAQKYGKNAYSYYYGSRYYKKYYAE